VPAIVIVALKVAIFLYARYLNDINTRVFNDFPYIFTRFLLQPILQGTMAALFSVSCHRIVLLGQQSLPNKSGLYFTKRELKYYGWCFLFGIPLYLGSAVVGYIALANEFEVAEYRNLRQAWNIIGIFVTAAITARLGLILPAIAVEDDLTFKSAGILVNGNLFPLTMILAIPAINLGIIEYGLVTLLPCYLVTLLPCYRIQ